MLIKPVINDSQNPSKQTLIFAAFELQRYLSAVSDNEYAVFPTKKRGCDKAIYLCVGADSLPKVDDAKLDDAIYINVNENGGVISGTNERAVLIGVYRYLKEKGFQFLRPGEGGEIYPEILNGDAVYVCEKASYRHRGICIEGSVFQKNLFDMIDWLPKAGMNTYFLQFILPRTFFDRWYHTYEIQDHETIDIPDDELLAMLELAEAEIEKRGLLYHAAGHGWTARGIGIEANGWGGHEEPLPEYRELLALINGERKLWGRVPLNTNLCYSLKKARDSITDCIVLYCKEHPNIDYVHFWLSDGNANVCECENCRDTRLADFLVMMCNELDEKLAEEKLDTKIAFISYTDCWWAPVKEKIINQDRFLLGYAPITRTYSESLNADQIGTTKPYVLNKCEYPVSVADHNAYLKQWQKDFTGDSFDFDYHFMWDQYNDFAQFEHARILHEDMRQLGELGFNGLVSCQLQRVFLPTCLGMNVMARTLWNRNEDFDTIVHDVLSAEFGENYHTVKGYLESLSQCSCAVALRAEESIVSDKYRERIKKSFEILSRFMPVIKAELEKPSHRNAWEKLAFHNELYRLVLEYYLFFIENKEAGNTDRIEALIKENELKFKEDFDGLYFLFMLRRRVVRKLKNPGNAPF